MISSVPGLEIMEPKVWGSAENPAKSENFQRSNPVFFLGIMIYKLYYVSLIIYFNRNQGSS
jgi:hypothetical protein